MAGESVLAPLRILILGCGAIGQRHIRNLLALKASEVLAFDIREDRRRAVETELGVPTRETLDETWDWKPEVVFVTSGTDTHVPLALMAAEHGCHLFIEKPLSHSLSGVDSLCAEVERRRLVTMVGCNMRFHPGPVAVKRLLNEGVIGQVIAARIQAGSYLPRWRPQQDYRQSYSASPEWGGAIMDCIHEIDLALWYLGPAKVAAAAYLPARTIGLATDGLSEIILRHESGALTNVHLNFVQCDYRRTCQIIGSEGTIYWDFADHCVRIFDAEGEFFKTVHEPQGWESNQMYVDELTHFCSAVRNKSQTAGLITGGLEVLKVALAAKEMGAQWHK